MRDLIQIVRDQVEEIRRAERILFDMRACYGQRRVYRFAVLGVIDVPVGSHEREHYIAALFGRFGIAIRIEVARALHHSRKRSGFGKRDIGQTLTEEELSALGESVNAVRSLAAEVHLVCVGFEDLLLGPFVFDVDGHHGFGDLALPALVGFQIKGTHKLHGERGGALLLFVVTEIDIRGLDDTRDVDAFVREEVFVLGRGNSLDQDGRNLVEGDDDALFARCVQVGEEGRADRPAIRGAAIYLYSRNAIAGDRYSRVSSVAGNRFSHAALDAERPGLTVRRLAVAGQVKFRLHVFHAERVTGREDERFAIDVHRVGEGAVLHFFIDDAGVMPVCIAERAQSQTNRDQHGCEDRGLMAAHPAPGRVGPCSRGACERPVSALLPWFHRSRIKGQEAIQSAIPYTRLWKSYSRARSLSRK